jgi:hypothetical protein
MPLTFVPNSVIITSPVTEIKDFERVPENIASEALNKATTHKRRPWFFMENQYMTAAQAAKLWGISDRRVRVL